MQFSLKSCRNQSEDGFVLLAAIVMALLLLISVAVAAPMMAKSIQRDKEMEAIHRGEDYRRAIQLYYRKFGRYPTSIDQLVETNQVRFLRKKYKDPITGKEDWKPVLFGQAHVRPLGFFGQPLMAMGAVAGMGGMNGGMYAPAPSATDANGVPVAATDGSSATGAASNSSSGGGLFANNPSTPGTGLGSSPGSGLGSSPGSGLGSGSMFGSNPSSPMGGTPGTTSPSSGGMGGTSATSFDGGGPIVGFTLPVKKASLIDYMKQTHYNEWEFNYDPMADQAKAMGGLTGAPTNPNPLGTNGIGAPGTTNGTSPTSPNSPGPSPTDPNAQPPNNGSTLMPPDNNPQPQ